MKIIGLISPRHQTCCRKASDDYFSVHYDLFSWSLLPTQILPSFPPSLPPSFPTSHTLSLSFLLFPFLTSLEDDLHIYFSASFLTLFLLGTFKNAA